MSSQPFIVDLANLKRRAREDVLDGAVTRDYKADRTAVIAILNGALASEIVCVLRYKYHYFMASGIHARSMREEFLEHAADEQKHADAIATRIVQLDGTPNLSPEGLHLRSHTDYIQGNTIVEMLKEDLVAERIAVESYLGIIRYLGSDDPTTRRLIESILEAEEDHAEDLKSMLEDLGMPGEPAKNAGVSGSDHKRGNGAEHRP